MNEFAGSPMLRCLHFLFEFAYFYPLTMAYIWCIGALFYFFRWERKQRYDIAPELKEHPFVSIVVPCHNEGDNVRETIANLLQQNYPNFEIIAVNDGSKDQTGAILDELHLQHEKLRVIHMTKNQGKAMGLRMAALASKAEFLVTIDGDALLDPNATAWMVKHFIDNPRVGAVTGNPRIRNRSTLLGRIQVGEFSAIIGLIKRAQRVYGRVFTMSGVVSAFRVAALERVGYWSTDMITEDIDVTWKLQLDHWDVRYEPNAVCWILMPETLKGLWRQRLRWAQGGAEVAIKYFRNLFSWRKRRMWLVYVEFLLSVLWSYTFAVITVLWLIGLFVAMPEPFKVPSLIPEATGAIIGLTCMIQFAVGALIDHRFEPRGLRSYYWIIWYPMAYFLLGMVTTVAGLPKALGRKKGRFATWVSPDRGLRT
jgi:biofilm PGA synthesis N-glycosyltransferase PgaC